MSKAVTQRRPCTVPGLAELASHNLLRSDNGRCTKVSSADITRTAAALQWSCEPIE